MSFCERLQRAVPVSERHNLLGREGGVKRLKRGGSLFGGIAQGGSKEHYSDKLCEQRLSHLLKGRSDLWGSPNASIETVSDHFTASAARMRMLMGRVFIVDDEEHVRKTVGLALKQGGYEVIEAADGEEAIIAIQSYPPGFSVHAIICDIGLPKVNGHDVITFIRAKLPSVPVIVLTGQADVQGAAELFKQGVVDYLIKPAQAQTLLDAVRRAIGEQALLG